MLATDQATEPGGDAMSLGSLLKERRARLGLTQKQVAEEAEIGLSYYKQIETDRANPTLDKAVSLVRVLSIDPRAMFHEIEPGVFETEEEDGPSNTDDPIFGEVKDVVDTLRAVQGVFEKKPTSRRLPAVIVEAENVLMHTDVGDLKEAATVLGFDIDFPDEEEFEDGDEEEQDDLCQTTTCRLIIAAMYGDAFENADIKTLETIANDIRDRVYGHKSFIESKSWLFEDEDEYLERLRRELAPHIVEAAKQRKAPDLDNLFDEEEED